jgi:hypothetical protein
VGAEDAADALASSALDHPERLADDPDLWAGPGLRKVGVWAATSDRAGWLVLGAASDEATFWTAIAEDEDLDGVRLDRPATFVPAYFLTDLDGSGDLRDS